jgi:hypothetical protein
MPEPPNRLRRNEHITFKTGDAAMLPLARPNPAGRGCDIRVDLEPGSNPEPGHRDKSATIQNGCCGQIELFTER